MFFVRGQSSLVHKNIRGHFRGHELSPKGRTDMKIGRSKANKCAESHGNLCFSVAPQKPMKKHKN